MRFGLSLYASLEYSTPDIVDENRKMLIIQHNIVSKFVENV